MGKLELPRGEEARFSLTPHPLSMLGRYLLPLYFLFWGSLFYLLAGAALVATPADLIPVFAGTDIAAMSMQALLWAAGYVAGAGVAWVAGRDRVIAVGAAGAGTIAFLFALAYPPFAPALGLATIGVALAGVGAAELSRRSHRAIVTSRRIVLRQGLLVARERMVRLEKVSGLESSQTILGRLFDFGDIVPTVKPEDPADRPRHRRVKGAREQPAEWRIRGVYPFTDAKERLFRLMSERVNADYEDEVARRDGRDETMLKDADTLKRLDDLLKPAKGPDE